MADRRTVTQAAGLTHAIAEKVKYWDIKFPDRPVAMAPKGVKFLMDTLTSKNSGDYGTGFISKANRTHFIAHHLKEHPDLKFKATTNRGYYFFCKSRAVFPSFAWFGKEDGKHVVRPPTTSMREVPVEPIPRIQLPSYDLFEDVHFGASGGRHIYFLAEPGYLKTTQQFLLAEWLINEHYPYFVGIVVLTGKKATYDQLKIVSILYCKPFQCLLTYFALTDHANVCACVFCSRTPRRYLGWRNLPITLAGRTKQVLTCCNPSSKR